MNNSPIRVCLGDGNKIACISVVKLWPFFSGRERTNGSLSINPSPASSVPGPSIQTDKWTISRPGRRRRDNDCRPGKVPLERFFDPAYLVSQWPFRLESEISIQFDQLFRIITPTNIDFCQKQVS